MLDKPLNMNPCHLPPVHAKELAFLEHAIPIGIIVLVVILVPNLIFKFKKRGLKLSLYALIAVEAIMTCLYFIFAG